MHLTSLEIAVGVPVEAIGTLATARWVYHHPKPDATDEMFGWDWFNIAICLLAGLLWLPFGAFLLVAGAVAWSPGKKAN